MTYSDEVQNEMTAEERAEFLRKNAQTIADITNNAKGALSGYDCPICKNRGFFLRVDEDGATYAMDCRCMKIRLNQRRLERSGLADMAEKYNFENWQNEEPWQEKAKQLVLDYAEKKSGWLFIGGSVGAGKTHLCTAACLNLIKGGIDTRYVLWRDLIARAKAAVNDEAQYRAIIEPLKAVKALYIDDFLKVGKGEQPTTADINFAFELLNYRYGGKDKLTIISSERTPEELLAIDEALASRIYEKSKGYRIVLKGKKNWRLI